MVRIKLIKYLFSIIILLLKYEKKSINKLNTPNKFKIYHFNNEK